MWIYFHINDYCDTTLYHSFCRIQKSGRSLLGKALLAASLGLLADPEANHPFYDESAFC